CLRCDPTPWRGCWRARAAPRGCQARIDLDGEFRLDAKALGAVAMAILDAAFGEAPVAAHVPLAGGAGHARLGIGPAHDPDHEVAWRESALIRGIHHGPERLMAEHEALLAGR